MTNSVISSANNNRTIAGKTISRIGLGCVTFGREIDEQASFAMMNYAVSNGIRFFDTAAAYVNGASEIIVGRWLRKHPEIRERMTLATKILPPFNADSIERSVDECLKRLQAKTIDLLYLHRWDTTLQKNSLHALNDLIERKKVSMLGASNFTTKQLSDTLQLQAQNNFTPFQFVQNNHNLAVSDVPNEFKEICLQHKINIITYSPLGAGFLTGKHTGGVQAGTRFDLIPGHQDVYFNDTAYSRLKKLQKVAARTGHTSSHLALAWALHQPDVASVLIGGRTTAHIDQAIAALAFDDPEVFSELENT